MYDLWQPSVKKVASPDDYLPSWSQSVPFARRNVSIFNLHPTASEMEYERLARFQGKLVSGMPMFFCGGPILSAAWCPMPFVFHETSVKRDQYLALGTLKDEHRFYGAAKAHFSSNYLIQIWNCGPLSNVEASSVSPKLEFGIAVPYGRVWGLEWCPSGCFDDSRIGVLAAACSDGTVRLISVPNPSTLSQPTRYLISSNWNLVSEIILYFSLFQPVPSPAIC